MAYEPMAGLEAARARGRKGGRKRVMDAKKIAPASKPMRRPGAEQPRFSVLRPLGRGQVGTPGATLYP